LLKDLMEVGMILYFDELYNLGDMEVHEWKFG
jgi:hypothetical protein